MIKITKNLLPLLTIVIIVTGCEKECEKPQKTLVEILTSKSWRFASWVDDKNPSTNPEDLMYYRPYVYSKSDCLKDDIFQFKPNGKLQMFYGEENCIWLKKKLMDYEYNEEYQQLIIDGTIYPVLEISEQQIKFLILMPPSLGYFGFIVILQ